MPRKTKMSQISQTEIPSDNNKQEYDNNVNTNEILVINGDYDLVFDEIKQLNNNAKVEINRANKNSVP